MTTVTNISSQHLAATPKFQSCSRSLALSDSATASTIMTPGGSAPMFTIAPGESAPLLHPRYTIGALHESTKAVMNRDSTSTSRSADDKGVEVMNGGHKTLVFKSSDEDEDDVVLDPGELATLQGEKYDIDIEDT
ncbi:hypothetical protein APHAL10511_000037 [Amanita phalloides]|nr:hypothetical protein APHAL10511_000037 [Amanita phalloides]